MASVPKPLRQLHTCLRCIRQTNHNSSSLRNGASVRLLSSSSAVRDGVVEVNAAPPPDAMAQWGPLDPNTVDNKRDERRLVRREGLQPIGSRRRRVALQYANLVPFEQLPYQCFQEARKVLQEDREEKLKQMETQKLRMRNLAAQDPAAMGGVQAKETRLGSMRARLNELIILADINDPMAKKRFEDGEGDMNKPIYRYLADRKWRQYKRLILEQRIKQLSIVPDILPALDPIADVDLAFGRRKIGPGDFVDSRVSEGMPRLKVQTFEPGQKLVTVVVVDPDVPVLDKDSFTYRCHFIANNIPISPTETSIPLNMIDHQPKAATEPSPKHISVPWLSPWAHRGAPYHRLAVFVLEQPQGESLDVEKISKTKRMDFILRSFIDKNKLKPVGVTLFRTKWDENTAGVMERAGFGDQVNVEFKRKRIEPLPHKRRTERMR
ncbi:phosphatidylethanolamine-binding protein [Clohesyomyces aquaticus]|uniref:Large ribosomal subunit protein mL38 n=1 Tax=Clohesyomyces aquaticus TaxID=1231657 RepID=A0A1Y1Y9N7_9PLEO|nr:phosphatidylethanolamine-binding protein [Clohesyomyces aquaticus]